MGCSSSKAATPNVAERPSNPQVEVEATHRNENELGTIFIGVSPNLRILCRDEFQSKYTEDIMYRWRPAEILKVEGDDRSNVLVRYIGWAETFDHWVDLKTDCAKLAPENLLSKEQCLKGTALSEVQAQTARDFFQHGSECTGPVEQTSSDEVKTLPLTSDALAKNILGVPPAPSEDDLVIRMPAKLPEPVIPVSAVSNTVVAKRRVPTSTPMMVPARQQAEDPAAQSTGPALPSAPTVPKPVPAARQQSTPIETTSENPYCARDMIDVLDIFYKKGASVPSQKWRPAEITEVVGDYITIHYLNWDDKYNERLHHRTDAHRLSSFGSKATRNVSSGSSVQSARSGRRGSDSSLQSSGAAGVSSSSNEGSELDRSSPQHRIHIPPHGILKKEKSVSAPSTTKESDQSITTSATASEPIVPPPVPEGELTAEQYSFTRSFLNYRKKRQADPASNADPESGKKSLPLVPAASTSERPDGFLKQVSMMSFSNIFGTRDGNNASTAPAAATVVEVVATVESTASPSAKAKNGEEKERNHEEIAAREQLFLEKLEAKGLHVFAIEGDGNCLFRAVSHQLYLHQDMHDELRACVVEHLIRHRKRFEVFVEGDFEEHLKEMSKLGTWADDLEIRALEEITDRVIIIYSSDVENVEEPLNNNFEERNLLRGVPPLTLSYHGQSHYNSIYDERYPLPLVHRKSRLLLRSRTALSKQDHLTMASQGQSNPSLSSNAPEPAYPPVGSQPVMYHPSAYNNNKNQISYHHPGGYTPAYHAGYNQVMTSPPPHYRQAGQGAPSGASESSSLSRSESDELSHIPNPHYNNGHYPPGAIPYSYNPAYGSADYHAQAQAHGQYHPQYGMQPPGGYLAPVESTDSQDYESEGYDDASEAPQSGHAYAYPGEATHYSAYVRPAQQYGYPYPQSAHEYEATAGAY